MAGKALNNTFFEKRVWERCSHAALVEIVAFFKEFAHGEGWERSSHAAIHAPYSLDSGDDFCITQL